jgi:hypothetical protein
MTLPADAWKKLVRAEGFQRFTDIEGGMVAREPQFVPSPLVPSALGSFRAALGRWLDSLPDVLRNVVRFMLPICFCVLYCAARFYVVLESFISLRNVPVGVYETPSGNFINYIPHL